MAKATSRKGGKPKGHKNDGPQLMLAAAYTTTASDELLAALNTALPRAAFDELKTIREDDEVAAWCDRWGVDAPGVMEAATDVVRLFEADREKRIETDPNWSVGRFPDRTRGPSYPKSWAEEYSRLNGLPLDRSWLDDVLNSPIEPIVSAADPDLPRKWEEAVRASGDVLLQRQPLPTLAQGEAFVSAVRARALGKPRVLAPIAADPVRESREHFLRRAKNHWNGRAAVARRMLADEGVLAKVPSAKSSLPLHVSWLVRFQVGHESFAAIADGPPAASRRTVETTVRRLARWLRLKLRKGPRGRPKGRNSRRG